MSASGPTVWMCSKGSCARRTYANLKPPKETTHDRNRDPGRLWRADRARHVEDPAPSARTHRARLGLSHGERSAPPVAGGGPDGDEGRRAFRIRLAERRAYRSARPAAARLLRRAPDAEPDHRTRSAPQACLHLEWQWRRFLRTGTEGQRGAAHRDPSPPARPRNPAEGRSRLAHAPRHSGRPRDRQRAGAILGRLEPPAERIRPADAGLTETTGCRLRPVKWAG